MSLDERVDTEKRLVRRIKERSKVGLSVAIRPDEYQAIMKDHGKAISAYTLLLMISVVQIRDWAATKGYKGKFIYIFEAGHRHAAEANVYMNALHQLGPDHHYYGGHAFLDKKQALPLQAADMLAWLHRNNVMRIMKGVPGRRKDFQALLRPIDLGSHVQAEHLHELKAMMNEGVGIFDKLPDRLRSVFPRPKD